MAIKTPILLSLGVFLLFSADAFSNYRECLRGGGKGEAESCRGRHRGHRRHEGGRHKSHVSGGMGRFRAMNTGHSGAGGEAGGQVVGRARSGGSNFQAASIALGAVIASQIIRDRGARPAAAAAEPQSTAGKPLTFADPNGRKPADEDDDTAKEISAALGRAGFSSLGELQGAVQQDIADCSGAMSSASRCCGDPASCKGQLGAADSHSYDAASALLSSGPAKGGLKDYCGQMKTLSSNSRSLNSGLAGVCFEAQDTCESMCEDLVQEYSTLLSSCNGCEAQSSYQSALQQLQDGQRTCSGLGTKADQLADNGFGNAADQMIATHCSDVAGAQAGPPARDSAALGMPGDKTMAAQAMNEGKAAGSLSADASGKPRMDLRVDASQGFKGYKNIHGPETQRNEAGSESGSSARPGVAPSSAGSTAGGAPAQAAAVAAPVKQSQAPAGKSKEGEPPANVKPKVREIASDPIPIPGSDLQFENKTDLRQYLPSGVRSAMSRLARPKEINQKEEDIFLRITLKMKEKCKMGLLWECD